jgi:hypothetical protein
MNRGCRVADRATRVRIASCRFTVRTIRERTRDRRAAIFGGRQDGTPDMLRAVDVLVANAIDQLDQREITDSRLRAAIEACAADQDEARATKKFGGMMIELASEDRLQMDRVRISRIFDNAVSDLPAAADDIDALWTSIEGDIPKITDWFGHHAEVSGYYGR